MLTATAITVGTAPAGFNAEVHGLAVDDRYVYATSGTTGVGNGHDTADRGELVIFDRNRLRTAVTAGTAPPDRRITVGRQPRSVACLVRSDYERVFVVNYHQHSYSVTVLDRRTFEQINEAPIGMAPIDVAGGVCDSARCSQATHHPQHRAAWATHAQHIEAVFLGNPRLSKPERARARAVSDRATRIVAEIDAATGCPEEPVHGR